MQLSEFRAALDRRTGLAFDPAAQTAWVNEALGRITRERDWPWLDGTETITLVDGTAGYALPARWVRTRVVTIDGEPVVGVAQEDADSFDTWQERPALWCYTIRGGEIVFLPTPSGSASAIHRYVVGEATLTNDSDTPELPARFDDVVVSWAASRAYERVRDFQMADRARAEFESALVGMWDETRRRTGTRSVRVRNGSLI